MFFHTLLATISNGYKFEWLIVLSVFAIILAIFTIVTKSPVYSILYLIGLFVAISLYLIASGLPFIGISYILIYVGAISILFLFILMLINVRISELLTEGRNGAVLSILVVLAFTIPFNTKLPYSIDIYQYLSSFKNITEIKETITFLYNISFLYLNIDYVSAVSSYSWDAYLIEISHISAIGNILYSWLYILLIIISIILLVAIIGCIITTVKPKDSINNLSNNINKIDI